MEDYEINITVFYIILCNRSCKFIEELKLQQNHVTVTMSVHLAWLRGHDWDMLDRGVAKRSLTERSMFGRGMVERGVLIRGVDRKGMLKKGSG